MYDARIFRKNVLFLIGATRGGPLRARIIQELIEAPSNPNQLARTLGVDYKTITHHLSVLRKNQWVYSDRENYGEQFFLAFTEEQKTDFALLMSSFGKKLKTTKEGN
ncbi:MAG: winged helix-turn-helix transcriptional regulator [Candidatus Diapherotrites archaeon]|nr:winged helix-turn-helix transcriptional regulator [Candidatus Diapherotrites archaeon]